MKRIAKGEADMSPFENRMKRRGIIGGERELLLRMNRTGS